MNFRTFIYNSNIVSSRTVILVSFDFISFHTVKRGSYKIFPSESRYCNFSSLAAFRRQGHALFFKSLNPQLSLNTANPKYPCAKIRFISYLSAELWHFINFRLMVYLVRGGGPIKRIYEVVPSFLPSNTCTKCTDIQTDGQIDIRISTLLVIVIIYDKFIPILISFSDLKWGGANCYEFITFISLPVIRFMKIWSPNCNRILNSEITQLLLHNNTH